MKGKVIQKKESLLDFREEGRKEALEVNAMQAHGKIMGMDTFSWINPNMDQLSSVLTSFPFRIIWISTLQQFKKCIAIEPSLSKSIETIILHNTAKSKINEVAFFSIKNIISVQSSEEALQLMSALRKKNCVFLFSTEGNHAQKDRKEFEKFIDRYR